MGNFHLIRKNLGRKKVRTLFTGLSVFVAFLLYGLLGALNQAFNIGVEMAGANRLITIHKVSLIQLLPIAHRRRIESLDNVSTVVSFTWFGGYYQDPRQQFFISPTEPEQLLAVYSEWQLPEEQKEAWFRNRTGLLVGEALANGYGWKVGDRIPIGTSIWTRKDGTRTWDFTIEAIYSDGGTGASESAMYFHFDYFDEGRQFGDGLVGWYVVQVEDPDGAAEVATAIDGLFANSPAETKTTTEKGWVQGFAKQFGNIGLMVTAVMGAVFFTMLLVAGNTMAQSVRERTNELAVLKTLGFSDLRILGMVIGESVLLSSIAGGLGLFFAIGMAEGMRAGLSQFLPGFGVSNASLMTGAVLVLVLGVAAAIVPAWQAMRLNVVQALARR